MSSQGYRFKVGEQVIYPHIFFGPEGRHRVVQDQWRIKAIFPVSGLALIARQGAGEAIHVGLEKLMMYN